MYKIIDLDIDEALSADTKVEAVALVNQPAIETEFVYFNKQKYAEDTFVVTNEISKNACRARKYKEEKGTDCGTAIGWTRSAQLCNKENISLDTVKRMYSYLSRHKVDLESSKSYDDGCGLLMYDCWGGKPALDWSERILSQYEDFDYDITALPDYVDYATGSTENDMLIEPIAFIQKIPYERKDEYIQRCIAYHVKEHGMGVSQSTAICYSQADEAFGIRDKVSFDYHETLNTEKGADLARQEILKGSTLYIISAAKDKTGMSKVAQILGIPPSRVYAMGSNEEKIKKIKELGINIHYDNNEDVVRKLGKVGHKFSKPTFDDWDEDDLKLKEYFDVLVESNDFSFGSITNPLLRGYTKEEIAKFNHKNPTKYYRYAKLAQPLTSESRDFCDIEGRFFRRGQIYGMSVYNTEFGHNKQPYDKWLWKGGPWCVHGWEEWSAVRDKIRFDGVVPDTPGLPPYDMIGRGYYPGTPRYLANLSSTCSECQDITKEDREQYKKAQFKSDDEKRLLYSPLMVPGILIPRIENDEKYFVRFTKDAIEKIQRKFMIEQRLRHTNLEHNGEDAFDDMVMVESWLVNGKSDKAFTLGYDEKEIPEGTWMVGYKILDTPEGDNIWNNYVKTGKVKGLSAEGAFLMNFSRIKTDEYLLDEIINILNKIN